MVAWSNIALRSGILTHGRNTGVLQTFNLSCKGLNALQVRHCKSRGGIFNVVASDYQWVKFKDLVKFYAFIGLIPVAGIFIYTQLFIGPAKLQLIPEGYEPKHWEYHPHPVTRFIARYFIPSPQKQHEVACFVHYYQREQKFARDAEKQARKLMRERGDYQGQYYAPSLAKYGQRMYENYESEVLVPEEYTYIRSKESVKEIK